MRLIFTLLCVVILSGFLGHHHGGGGGNATIATIQSVQLSGSNVKFAASGPYYVGTLTTNLAPQTPTFNNLGSAAYNLVASGGSCSGGDTTHFQITGDGVYTNALAAGTYKICITASATGVTPYTATFTGITEGNKIDAAATYCAANGGGNGSAASPWQAACIQAAMNAAVAGDTVYLGSGNWNLSTANAPATTSKSINLVGAGSGNTFNAYGQPNNASGTVLPTVTTASGITRIYTSGANFVNGAGTGGYAQFAGSSPPPYTCNNVAAAHLYVDGSASTDGGGPWGTLNFLNCAGIDVNDVRANAFSGPSSAEGQFWIGTSNNITIENSIFADIYVSGTFYPSSVVAEAIIGNHVTVTNSYFYQNCFSPIAFDNVTFTGNTCFESSDANGFTGVDPGFAVSGCGIGPGAGCTANLGTNGSYFFTAKNNYFNSATRDFGLGGGLNDPGTGGGNNALTFSGNTIVASLGAVDSCVWHYYDPTTTLWSNCRPGFQATSASWSASVATFVVPNTPTTAAICPSGTCSGASLFYTAGFSPAGYNTPSVPNAPFTPWTAATESCGGGSCTITASEATSLAAATTLGYVVPVSAGAPEGMQINGTVQSDCSESNTPSTAFTATNNTISSTSAAVIDAAGTGIVGCRLAPGPTNTLVAHDNTVVGFTAQQNYLSSPHSAYVSNVETINPTVNNNYGIDVSSGFTSPPTASFTLGPLEEPGGAYDVPFTATNFTAQFGAVQWLASTSPTTPTSGGQTGTGCAGSPCSWSFVPPALLYSVTHGNTVYLWTMDSLNHISVAASALIP